MKDGLVELLINITVNITHTELEKIKSIEINYFCVRGNFYRNKYL